MASCNDESGPQQQRAAAQPVVKQEELEDSSSTEPTLLESGSDGSRNPRSGAAVPDNCARNPSKRVASQRWSKDDEIAILNGLMAYSIRKQSDPMQDMTAFFSFVKGDLHTNCTRDQLQIKVKHMRQKYERNKGKEKDGEEMSFSQARDGKVYELMKSVWESGGVGKRCKMGRPKGSGNKGKGKAASAVFEQGKRKGKGKGKAASEIFEHGEPSMVMKACEEIFGLGKTWKNIDVEEAERHCKKLEEKLAKSRFVLTVLKAAEL